MSTKESTPSKTEVLKITPMRTIEDTVYNIVKYIVKNFGAEVVKQAIDEIQYDLNPKLDNFPSSHKDEQFCECDICMGFVSLIKRAKNN